MASIRREVMIEADPDVVWDALRDWDALHERLAAEFVTDCLRDGTARIVTFASGAVLREEILGCDEEHRRLAWSIVDGPYTHHNGAAEVLVERDGRTKLVWMWTCVPTLWRTQPRRPWSRASPRSSGRSSSGVADGARSSSPTPARRRSAGRFLSIVCRCRSRPLLRQSAVPAAEGGRDDLRNASQALAFGW